LAPFPKTSLGTRLARPKQIKFASLKLDLEKKYKLYLEEFDNTYEVIKP